MRKMYIDFKGWLRSHMIELTKVIRDGKWELLFLAKRLKSLLCSLQLM